MNPCCNKTGYMSHVYKKYSSYLISYLSKLLKVYHSRISRCTCNNHLRLVLLCKREDFIIIQETFVCNSIRHNIVKKSGEVHR